MNWFKKKKKAPKLKFYNGISVRAHEWRANDSLVKEAFRVQSDPYFAMMLEVMRNESPALLGLAPGTDLASRAVWQASIEGYNHAIAMLLSLAEKAPQNEPMQETFEKPITEE